MFQVFRFFLRALFAGLFPGFASVMLTDVITPAVYESYSAVDNPETTAFFDSGVAVRLNSLDTAFDSGGTTVHMPFWLDLDPTVEPNYSTDSPSDVAVPDKVTATEMIARIAFMNKGYSAGDLVQQIAGSNPMQRIRDKFGRYWQRVFQRRLLAAVKGVLANNMAKHSGDMVNSIAQETLIGQTAANLFSRTAFTGAAFTMGDQFDAMTAIAVHSVVYKRMVDNDDISFERPAVVDPTLPVGPGTPYFLGKRVIVDDSMPVVPGSTSGFKYTSALFGPGVIGYGENLPPVPVEVYRRPDQGNGAGIEQLWERENMIIHPFGHKFTSNSVAGVSPTYAELALATNWVRVVPFRKQVPLAFLLTNG